jgi:preprotein translocase subunit SecD
MLEYARWKYVVAALLLVASLIYSLPNLFPQDPAVQVSGNRGADVDAALVERVRGVLEQAGVGIKSVAIEEEGRLLARLLDSGQQLLAAERLRETLGDDYIVALNLASTVPDWLDAIGAKPMLLGLDLQGGVQFLMQVDERAAVEKRETSFADDIRALLREESIRYTAVTRTADGIAVQLREGEDAERAAALVASTIPELEVQETGASGFTAQLSEPALRAILDSAIEQNLGTLRNRIAELGLAEPIVAREGASRIIVELPGVQDTAQAKKILGATATLEYRAVAEGNALEALESGRVPPDARIYYRRERGFDGQPIPVLLSKRIIVSGDQLVDANAGFDPQTGQPEVNVTLNNVGAERMLDFTTENVGKGMAVVFIERTPETRVVDGKEVRTTKITEEVISVANINGIFGKRFRTTGLESSEYAAELALLLRAGALAAPVEIIQERIIGPSLGAENIEAGWKAVAASFLLVLVFFVVYYRMFGLITNIALLLNLLMLVAVMSLLGATLTLPGLAGIALTVGLSVDANVLINERIREELRNGNTPLASIANGYDKAGGTIVDANLTALLAGIALVVFGSGPVKGFGFTLCIGILTSMYTAVSVSRGVATLIYGGRRKLTRVSV